MGLFQVEGNKVLPHPQTLLISPFKDLWEDDETEKKDKALEQFAYIEFLCSFQKTNPFFNYTDLDERRDALIKYFKREVETDSPFIVEAIVFYNDQIDSLPSMKFYKSSLNAARKLATFFDTFQMTAVNARTGNPLYKPAEITRALKETSDIIKTLQALEAQVMQEIVEAGKGKGGREINIFER